MTQRLLSRCRRSLPALVLCLLPVAAHGQGYLDPSLPIEQRVDSLLSLMTLDEKIGQMMAVDYAGVQSNFPVITSYALGCVFNGGGTDPLGGNSPLSWRSAYDTAQSYALRTRLRIPLLYGVDAVHGHSNVVGATIFPHNIGMGCTRDSLLIREEWRTTAEEMAATGIRWDFGPMIGVPRDERWGRTYEGFGETPELSRLGAIGVEGLQGDSLSAPTSVLACAKHYLGDGGTAGGQDQGNTIADDSTMRAIHLPGYLEALRYKTGSIMVSFSSVNGVKMHASTAWLTNVLKQELGFEGFLVSDWGAIDQLGTDYTQDVRLSVNAGLDMIMLPYRYADCRTAMRALVADSSVAISRIDDAVRRILRAKFAMGLFEHPHADTSMLDSVGSLAHRAVARQCVRESLVLLKRKDGVLPLPKQSGRILVAGAQANDIGDQCGGWTISWQGASGNTTIGTTILQGMRNAAPGVQMDYSATGNFTDTTGDYSVVIIGETPYAEGYGDRQDLGLSDADVNLVRKMKGYGHPLVLVLVSGRPLILSRVLHFADAIVAAWLPGTEGEGVADVLFGDALPHGLLSHSWPKSMSQIPINFGDSAYAPLYPYGYGITSFSNSPAGSPPLPLSGIVTQDGGHIEITFNKPMAAPLISSVVFSVQRNGTPYASVIHAALKSGDSTTILLSLDSAFVKNDPAAVAYNAGDLQAADGGLLAPFQGFELYNWSTASTTSSVRQRGPDLPRANRLMQNYPNPFNPETAVSYQLSAVSRVTLEVYDVLGRRIETLVRGVQQPGSYVVKFNGARFGSGVYFCRLTAGEYVETRRMVLIR